MAISLGHGWLLSLDTGLADSAQLGEGPSGQALPTLTHHHTNKRGHVPHTGATRSTAWLGRAAPGPGAQGGGRARIPPAPGAIHLGYAGVSLPYGPPRPSLATYLSYTSSIPSPTLPSCGQVCLGPSPPATLSNQQLTMVRASKLCLLSPSSALGRW